MDRVSLLICDEGGRIVERPDLGLAGQVGADPEGSGF